MYHTEQLKGILKGKSFDCLTLLKLFLEVLKYQNPINQINLFSSKFHMFVVVFPHSNSLYLNFIVRYFD